jgi:hypothetical protein
MSVAGTCQLVIQSPMGEQHLTPELREDEGRLTGAQTNEAVKRSGDLRG